MVKYFTLSFFQSILLRMDALNLKRPPKYLYKYKSLTGESASHIKQLIVDKLFYFSPSTLLNDPFEFSYKYVNTKNNRDIFSEMYSCYLHQGYSKSDAIKKAREISGGFRDFVGHPEDFVKKHPQLDDRTLYKNVGIFCLTEDSKNIQMWSYYADSHKGLCIEFDTTIMSPDASKTPAIQVRYSEDNYFPKIEVMAEMKDIHKKVGYKHQDWKHEKEWRVFWPITTNDKLGLANGLAFCTRNVITSIILGIRAAEDKNTIETVKSWINEVKEKDNHTIKLKQAVAVPGKFEIDIVDFPE